MSRHHNARAQAAARRSLAPLVASGAAICRRCGLAILPGQPWDAGHIEDLGLGGHTGGAVAEHEHEQQLDHEGADQQCRDHPSH